MGNNKIPSLIFLYLLCWVFIISCNDAAQPAEKKIVADPRNMDKVATEGIQQVLAYALQHSGSINDSIHLDLIDLVNEFYEKNDYANTWSHQEKWEPLADTVIDF